MSGKFRAYIKIYRGYPCSFILKNISVKHFSFNVVPAEGERWSAAFPLNGSRHETAGDVEVLVIILPEIIFLPPPGVLVAGRAARVFTNASLRVDAHVLPVTIAANNDHVLLLGNKRP